jgi:uncharacterized membrane protein
MTRTLLVSLVCALAGCQTTELSLDRDHAAIETEAVTEVDDGTSEPISLEAYEQQALADATAAYAALDDAARASLWAEQLDRHLAGDQLSDEERKLVGEARERVAELVRGEGLEALEARAFAALGEERVGQLFETLGDPWTREQYQARAADSCTTRWTCASSGCRCAWDLCAETVCSNACSVTDGGCGFLGYHDCTGTMSVQTCGRSVVQLPVKYVF